MSRATPRMARARARSRSRRSIDRVTLIVLIAFLIVTSITAVLVVIWARDMFASTPATSQNSAPVVSGSGVKTGSGNSPVTNRPMQHEGDPTPVPWDGSSRITILVMGLDSRDWEEGDIPRTDSMILLSIDPSNKTAGMLSIPRDIWINVPGVGFNKINTAYRWGEINQLPGGGPALAMKTAEQLLGLPVNYYAMIDFNAFVKLIDEMGGLDMKIREEITIDPIGPGNTRVLEPGTQTLDGASVLAYARNRYTENDDFDRSRRQQEVIMAVRKQVLQFNMLPTLISKAPRMYADLASGIRTNLSLDQVIKLSLLAATIKDGNITKGVIGPPLQVEITTNPDDGQSILVPNPEQIRILRDEIFTAKGTAASETVKPVEPTRTSSAAGTSTTSPTADPKKLMKAEKARVSLKNGTSSTGLASKTSELLKSAGVNIVGEDNADESAATTTIYDYSGKPNTIKYLIDRLNLPGARVISLFQPDAEADIVIILGEDWAKQQK